MDFFKSQTKWRIPWEDTNGFNQQNSSLVFCISNSSMLLLSNASGMENQVEHSPIVKELQKLWSQTMIFV